MSKSVTEYKQDVELEEKANETYDKRSWRSVIFKLRIEEFFALIFFPPMIVPSRE